MEFKEPWNGKTYTVTLPLTELEYATIRAYYFPEIQEFHTFIRTLMGVAFTPTSEQESTYNNTALVEQPAFKKFHDSVKARVQYHRLFQKKAVEEATILISNTLDHEREEQEKQLSVFGTHLFEELLSLREELYQEKQTHAAELFHLKDRMTAMEIKTVLSKLDSPNNLDATTSTCFLEYSMIGLTLFVSWGLYLLYTTEPIHFPYYKPHLYIDY